MKKIMLMIIIACFLPGHTQAETSMEKAFKAAGTAAASAIRARSAAAQARINGVWRPGLSGSYIYDWKDGNRYEGGWSNDLLNGYGVFYFSNGNRYEGQWVNHSREGHGVVYYAGGERYEGEMGNNRLNGFGVKYLLGGTRLAGEWKDSVFVNEYAPPAAPNLLFPLNAAVDESLTPILKTGEFQDEDSDDFHTKTDWQVSTAKDFSSSVLYQQTTRHLTFLTVPVLTLEGNTTYYWRARFYDSFGNVSEWSSSFSFTTRQAFIDVNTNGIPDGLENAIIDLDKDGITDLLQTDTIKTLNTVVGNGQMGVSIRDSATVTGMTTINAIDPDTISEYARPHSMPLGMVSFRLSVENPGDTARVTVYFSEPAPENGAWIFHDAVNGWMDYSAHATFNNDRKSVVIELMDGDYGDADGIANGIIVDPSGFGIGSWLSGRITDTATSTGISNAVISFPDIDLSLNTLTDGRYLTLLLPGTYDLTVSASGYESQTITGIQISEAEIVTQDSELSGRTRILGFNTTGTPSPEASVKYTINAQSGSSAINYRYSIRSGYGTFAYDTNPWQGMTSTEYQPDSSCDYTFGSPDKSIVVVWATASNTSSVDPTGIPIIGWSVDTSATACSTHFTGVSITGDQKVNETITFTVNAENSCNKTRYYRFSVHPDYGTAGYDGTRWQSMTGSEWTTDNTTDYTFTEAGKYIIVVWVTDDPYHYDPTGIPIIGWSVDIE